MLASLRCNSGAFVFAGLASSVMAALSVEVVDDSDQPHSPYVLLVGSSVTTPAGVDPMTIGPGSGQVAYVATDVPYTPATVNCALKSGEVSLTLQGGGAGYQSPGGAPIPVSMVGGTNKSSTSAQAWATFGPLTVSVLAGGSGYTTAPTVTIVGGGGSGATATASVAGGAVTVIDVTSQGSGFTAIPTVTFVGGGGKGAIGVAAFGTSAVVEIPVTVGGSGYTTAPTVTIVGGGGSGATATASVAGGVVTAITVSNSGSGYTSVPVVSFSGGGGSGAKAVALLGRSVVGILTTNAGSGYVAAPAVSIPNSVIPLPASLMADTGRTVVSPYTGKTRAIRSFDVTTIAAGAFMVFANDGTGSPFTYSNNANPSATTANYRFDQCEFTFDAAIQSGVNLTSINALSMPMNLDLFATTGTGTNKLYSKVDARKFYASLHTILQQFPSTIKGALYQKSASGPQPGWQPSNGMSNFIRVMGPSEVAAVSATNATGSAAPYPSFANYLQYLAGLAPTSAASATAVLSTSGSSPYPVSQVNLGVGGAGFASPPAVTLSGGGTSGAFTNATATATVLDGVVTGIAVSGAGSGYVSAPTVMFSTFNVSGNANGSDYNYAGNVVATPSGNGYQVVLTGTTYATGTASPYAGAGLPASAQVTVNLPQTLSQATATAAVSNGGVGTLTLGLAGHGYMSPPIVTIAPPSGGGTAATATATLTAGGDSIASITVESPGSGYASTETPIVTINQPAGSMDTFIYGATLSGDSFGVAGLTPAQVASNTNIVYGAIARDVLAALNFGFIGGNWGNTGGQWFSAVPSSYPYANARPMPDDGYYNPYAALLYNDCDAYGFAFSDRISPSPLMTMQDGQTLRITILPDHWGIEAPQPIVVANSISNTSFSIEWPAVTGATSYQVTVLDPAGVAPVTVSAAPWQAAFGSLSAGTPYTVTVTAQGVAQGSGALAATSAPLQVITTGTAVPSTNGNSPFQLTLTYTPPAFLSSPGAMIAGTSLQYVGAGQWQNPNQAAGVTLMASQGATSFPFILTNSAGQTIYASNASIVGTTTGTSPNQYVNLAAGYFSGGTVTATNDGAIPPAGWVLTLIVPSAAAAKQFAPAKF